MKILNLVLGYIVVSILGVLFHFAYDFLNIDLLKIVFPMNESVFEHLKLIIFPCLIYMIIDLFVTKDRTRIFESYISGIFISMLFMIVGYYTYSGIIGTDISWANIVLFFICIGIVFVFRYKKITLFDVSNSVIVLIILLIIIELFTFYPADINLFTNFLYH